MKVFSTEDDKDIVFVQCKDLSYIDRHERTPKEVKDVIPIHALAYSNREEYERFDDPDFVYYMKHAANYILNYDEFKKLSDDEINSVYKQTNEKIKNAYNILDSEKKEERKKATNGINQAINDLEYYRDSIKDFVINKENNNIPKI